MLSKLANAIRRFPIINKIRKARYRKMFFSNNATNWSLWGEFGSFDLAVESLVDSDLVGFNNSKMFSSSIKYFEKVELQDYPTIYWLRRLIENEGVNSLVDFGGHTGVKFRAYQAYIDLPSSFAWQVVDVPTAVSIGRARPHGSWQSNLEFRSEISETLSSEILFCSGSLQYSRLRLPDILAALKEKPRFLVLNRLGVLPDSEIVSLEYFVNSRVAYRIQNLAKFNSGLRNVGYCLVDSWTIDGSTYSVPFVAAAKEIRCIGQVWELAP